MKGNNQVRSPYIFTIHQTTIINTEQNPAIHVDTDSEPRNLKASEAEDCGLWFISMSLDLVWNICDAEGPNIVALCRRTACRAHRASMLHKVFCTGFTE